MAARGSGRPPSRGRKIKEKQASKQAKIVNQIEVHTAMATQYLAKVPKTYARVKTASLTNGVRKFGRRM